MSTIASAEAFRRMLVRGEASHAQLVSVQAEAQVWWDVLERYPSSAPWVAANRQLPLEIAEHLSMHSNSQVRAALATSHCVPEHLMLKLAHDRSELIRLRVVCNAQATRDVLATMTADPCQVVAAHARERLLNETGVLPAPASYLDEMDVLSILH